VLRSSPLRRGPWPSRCVKSVAPGSARSCTADHSRLASLHLGASRLAQLVAASQDWRFRYVQSVATGPAQSCTSVHRCHSTSERRALSSSTLRRGTWPSRCVHSVAPGSAQSCTAAHHRLLRSSPLRRGTFVPLRAWRRVWSSSKLYGGPQPPRVTPPRSVAPCAVRRCVAGPGRPATCGASRLVQLKAAWRPTAASRHSTSERRVLRSSPLRRGPWPSRCVKSVTLSSAQSCPAAHSHLASLHLGASRVAQRRCVAVLGRPAACKASRLVQPKAAWRLKPHRVSPRRSVAPCAARRCVAGLAVPVRERPWTLKTCGGITDENLSEGMAIGEETSPGARREFTASINSCCEYSQHLK